jgi:hypothetical protein
MTLQNLLFPQFSQDKWLEININEIALQFADEPIDASESHWVEELKKMFVVDHLWGGWLEHRDFVLRDKYHKNMGPDYFWHLGIDYTVPVHSLVHLPVDATLLYHFQDPDQDGGWGGKLIFDSDHGLFVLGHLDQIVTESRHYSAGDVIGRVADRDMNGNWFPHLHIQCLREFYPNVDGYSYHYDGIELDFPNPTVQLVK